MISIDEAATTVLSEAHPLSEIAVALEEAEGYVLAKPVHADLDVPAFDRSMMDGYALAARESGKGKVIEIVATIAAGDFHSDPIPNGKAARIMTGAPLPAGCDAVIPLELTTDLGGNRVRLDAAVKPGENIAFQGEEIRKGQENLSQGTLIDAPVAAVLAQVGRPDVEVHRRPRVGILVTGAELADPGEAPAGSKVRESNSYGLVAQCRLWGAVPMRLGQAADDPTQLRAAIEGGLGHDILTITGGVSAGDYDLVPDSLRELGVEVLFHKVAQKPGMPLLFGKRGSTLVFGLPGNPVACFLCFELYVGPAVRRLAGEWDFETKWLDGVAGADSHVKSDRTHFKAAKVRFEGSRWRVHPMPSHGSADIFSVVGTNAFARFEKGKYTVSVGEQVRFFFYRAKQPLV